MTVGHNMYIGIDMDGVIADFVTPAVRNIKDKFGIDITEEDLVEARGSIDKLVSNRIDTKPKNKSLEIRDKIAPRGFFWKLNPYEGAIQSVFNLHDAGNNIIFITKTFNWLHCVFEKKLWLDSYFGMIDYELIVVGDMRTKRRVNVDIMIDDDERVIDVMPENTIKFLVRRPQNKIYRESTNKKTSFIEVDSIQEAELQITSWT